MDIKTVTVLGANGAMGANVSAIFASFGGARVYMMGRDYEKLGAARERAVKSVRADSIHERLVPVTYDGLEHCVVESDLIFDSTSEDWDVKSSVLSSVATIAEKHLADCCETVFATGTSGLSITGLAELFCDELRPSFVGMHLFNPPYVMTLCELIGTRFTAGGGLLKEIEEWLSSKLQRTVVRSADAPAFIGNRIGFQLINSTLQQAETYADSGGIDYMDAIMGPFTGRAMAPCATADFVGLDVHRAIVDNVRENTSDFANATFALPGYVAALVNDGRFGRKSGGGLYRTFGEGASRRKLVWDVASGAYREAIRYEFPFAREAVSALREGDYAQAANAMKRNHSQEAAICTRLLLTYVLYTLDLCKGMGVSPAAADDAMATGFNWCPPMAIVDFLGGKNEFARLCEERLDDGLLEEVGFDGLVTGIEPSKYDYRRYMRARR